MILFTNLYKNYTIASSNRFLMSVKVRKRFSNQMIEYIKFHNARQWEFFHYHHSQYLHTKEQIIDHLFERKFYVAWNRLYKNVVRGLVARSARTKF